MLTGCRSLVPFSQDHSPVLPPAQCLQADVHTLCPICSLFPAEGQVWDHLLPEAETRARTVPVIHPFPGRVVGWVPKGANIILYRTCSHLLSLNCIQLLLRVAPPHFSLREGWSPRVLGSQWHPPAGPCSKSQAPLLPTGAVTLAWEPSRAARAPSLTLICPCRVLSGAVAACPTPTRTGTFCFSAAGALCLHVCLELVLNHPELLPASRVNQVFSGTAACFCGLTALMAAVPLCQLAHPSACTPF